mmetsp:Transcript_103249/g.291570  ORF Transcript_103249/g.291570 Transcript_103249/m.291570 type:complete len:313 (+) Transcript_103249:252-1190(+)
MLLCLVKLTLCLRQRLLGRCLRVLHTGLVTVGCGGNGLGVALLLLDLVPLLLKLRHFLLRCLELFLAILEILRLLVDSLRALALLDCQVMLTFFAHACIALRFVGCFASLPRHVLGFSGLGLQLLGLPIKVLLNLPGCGNRLHRGLVLFFELLQLLLRLLQLLLAILQILFLVRFFLRLLLDCRFCFLLCLLGLLSRFRGIVHFLLVLLQLLFGILHPLLRGIQGFRLLVELLFRILRLGLHLPRFDPRRVILHLRCPFPSVAVFVLHEVNVELRAVHDLRVRMPQGHMRRDNWSLIIRVVCWERRPEELFV